MTMSTHITGTFAVTEAYKYMRNLQIKHARREIFEYLNMGY